ncbi:SDR family oxidoreductase (plasmid) [Rhizobium sp. 007]|nr:SDR family oxidoreductase [Rhizobium sp. 007]
MPRLNDPFNSSKVVERRLAVIPLTKKALRAGGRRGRARCQNRTGGTHVPWASMVCESARDRRITYFSRIEACPKGLSEGVIRQPRLRASNAVAPGPVETDMFVTGKSDELVQSIVRTIPLSRLCQPEDVALVVAFLASSEGAWVSGQVLRVNGGMI